MTIAPNAIAPNAIAIHAIEQAFSLAISRQKDGDERCWQAFEVAAALGWDCEDFPVFMRSARSMTDMQILIEGRARAVAFLKANGGTAIPIDLHPA